MIFEVLGLDLRGQSFLFNTQRLLIIILQVSIIGLLAIGVTQVIITGGVDLSSGSVVALSAMIAGSLAQSSDAGIRAIYPSLTDLPAFIPIVAGLAVGALAGLINGSLVAFGAIPAFIATLGMMVTARGLARFYTQGQPISMLTDEYTFIGSGAMPVIIFVATAVIFHVALRYTKYGKYTYAIGGNMQAARVSGINVNRHLLIVYASRVCCPASAGSSPRRAPSAPRPPWARRMNWTPSRRPSSAEPACPAAWAPSAAPSSAP